MLHVAVGVGDAYFRPVLYFARSETHGLGPINTWHCHDLYHLVYIVEGEGVFRLDGRDVRASPGRLFAIDPKRWHQFFSLSDPFCYDAITFELRDQTGAPCDRPLWELFAPPHQEFIRRAFADGVLDVPERLRPWVRAAFGAAMPRGPGSGESDYIFEVSDREALAVVTFLHDLGEIVKRALPGKKQPQHPTDQGFRRRLVDQALRYMNENFTRPLTLQEIARRFYLHPVYFSQVFKAEIGLPPRQYLLRLRISHACKLLSETDLSIREVAAASGFRTVSYFSRAFRAIQGKTPSEYRAQTASTAPRLVSPS